MFILLQICEPLLDSRVHSNGIRAENTTFEQETTFTQALSLSYVIQMWKCFIASNQQNSGSWMITVNHVKGRSSCLVRTQVQVECPHLSKLPKIKIDDG